WFGFRRMLTAMAVMAALFLAVNGLFSPQTPHVLILACLFVGGLGRSFFFTGLHVLRYADVSEAEASQATSIAAVMQQVAVALGIAVAGGLLEISTFVRGEALALIDFQIAWFAVAALAAISIVPFVRLPPDAGADVSGHRGKPLP